MRITTFLNHETLMNQVTLLRDALRPHLAWHGASLSFVAAFLIAWLRVKTVNFSELATTFNGQAQADSHYKLQLWEYLVYRRCFTTRGRFLIGGYPSKQAEISHRRLCQMVEH
jgi:hypothetical protein